MSKKKIISSILATGITLSSMPMDAAAQSPVDVNNKEIISASADNNGVNDVELYLSKTGETDTSISVSWTSVENAASYSVIVNDEVVAEDVSTTTYSNYEKEMRTMMGIYAGFAQEENKSMSDNIKCGIRERMREGKVCLNCTRFLGYDKDKNGKLLVVESEAVIVRKIFELYLNGFGVRKIKKYLEKSGIKTVTGKDVWSTSTIDRILSNEKYVGDVLMQKSFTEDFLTGKRKKNEGELAMYFIKNNHEAIISRELFEKVQKKKRKKF